MQERFREQMANVMLGATAKLHNSRIRENGGTDRLLDTKRGKREILSDI